MKHLHIVAQENNQFSANTKYNQIDSSPTALSMFISSEKDNFDWVVNLFFWLLVRLLIWMVLKDHFTRVCWWGFYQRLTRSAMFENSVNSFAHAACRLHVLHAWIARSIKSTFNGFLFVCFWDHFVHILKTCQSQWITATIHLDRKK